RPHGHVAAVLGTLYRLELDRIIAPRHSRERDLVVAMVAARLLDPESKLATARSLEPDTLNHTLSEELGVASASADDLYAAMDWLLPRQQQIEAELARRHLCGGRLVLYDVTSAYFEGRHCPLARFGYERSGKRGRPQIVFGLLCNSDGCPVAVEVFSGNTADPVTLAMQIEKVRERFKLEQVIMVGDRGLITEARIEQEMRGIEGLGWITALRAPAIRKLLAAGSLQLSLFDQRDMAEITDTGYPGERLVVCRNPILAEERARKREELLLMTEKELEKIVVATARTERALRGKAEIGMRVGRVLGKFKMGKHFRYAISDDSFSYHRDEAGIAAEAALDGIYVIRTNVPGESLDAAETVRTYKQLAKVERAFRALKGVDLRVRPIYHRLETRVRAHVLLCVLAYYVEWHMRQGLAPLLFEDEEHGVKDGSPVAPARRSLKAQAKASRQRLEDGTPVHGFQTLLKDLSTLSRNRIELPGAPAFDMLTRATPLQQRAFELLGLNPTGAVPSSR
ncbi:MAG: IS1634 family transposase, partial [Bacillota bacterium]|nr:IS1634 family transposase [Bacillota bacterium]